LKRLAIIWLAHVQVNRYAGFTTNAKSPGDDHRNQTIPKRLEVLWSARRRASFLRSRAGQRP